MAKSMLTLAGALAKRGHKVDLVLAKELSRGMKILVLSDGFLPDSRGGSEKIASSLALAYQRQGHEVIVIAATRNKAGEGVDQEKRIKTYRLYADYSELWRAYLGLYNPWVVRKARQIITYEQPEVIHAHNVHHYFSYHVLKAAKSKSRPVVLTFHDAMAVDYGKFTQGIPLHDLSEQPKIDYRVRVWPTIKRYRFRYFPFRNPLIRYYLHRYTDGRIAVSQQLQRLLESNRICCTGVIYNGIDPCEFEVGAETVEKFRRRFGLQRRKVILFLGRGGFWKGGQELIRALPRIVHVVPGVCVLIAGRQQQFAHLFNEANAIGVGNSIVATGWLQGNELAAAYHGATVVVAPSVYPDPFPTVVLEAMASKKPVVVSCFSGGKEAVLHGQTGYVVNPLNTEIMAQRLIDLLTNDQKNQQLGESGYQRLLNNFTLEKCASAYLALFEHLVSVRQ